MDRGRALAGLIAGWVLAAGAAAEPPLAAARWTVWGDEPVSAFGQAATECYAPSDDPEMRRREELGRAVFRTPLLLGGQAARAGLSCASCHAAGRDNPGFSFPGLSAEPGTADVTSSLTSRSRGDGVLNPVPIPSLVAPDKAHKISRDPDTSALEAFLSGIIMEEFDAAAPPPYALAGLAAYVRALRREACPDAAKRPVALSEDIADAARAIAIGRALLGSGEVEAGALGLAGARAALAGVHERFAHAELAPSRAALRDGDAAIAAAIKSARAGDRDEADATLALLSAGLPALGAKLEDGEPLSLYVWANLEAAFAAERELRLESEQGRD